MLPIRDYDQAEAEAISRASYPAVRAFRPAAFATANFPTRVRSEPELIRYADIMYELADRDFWYEQMLYSPDEAHAMTALSETIETLTRQAFGRGIRPFMCLFPPIPIWRTVTALGQGRKLKILEIGAGSGYLGAYLIGSGHAYCATDITQALYLWQDRLFAHLAPDSFANLAAGPAQGQARVTLLPWWQFAELFRTPPQVDIVICEAAMGEMDTFAANYIVRVAAKMLAESPVGAFLFCNIGEQRVNSMDYVCSCFARAGFGRTKLGPVTAHSLRPLGRAGTAPPIGAGAPLPARVFLPIDQTKLLESYAFFHFIDLLSAPKSVHSRAMPTLLLSALNSVLARVSFSALRRLRNLLSAG